MKFTQKAAAAASSLAALSTAPQVADAGIVHVDDMPIFIETVFGAPQVDWDVDDNGQRDFFLLRTSVYSDIELNSNGANGLGMVQNVGGLGNNIRNLFTGFVVGPTLAAGYQFSPSSRSYRDVLFSGTLPVNGFVNGVNLIGFQFTNGTDNLFGWAQVVVNINFGSATIAEWAYDDAGGSIAVGQTAAVPEPHSLALMAMGAAGVAAWRLRRKTKKDSTQQM